MLKMNLIVLYFLVSCYIQIVFSKCYYNSTTDYILYGTKTPYNSIRGDLTQVQVVSSK